jgi:hypothetical protein
MSIFLPPEQILDNPEFIQILLKPDGEGGHRLTKITHYTRIPSMLGDGWEDVLYFRHIGSHNPNESRKNGLGGYVYILTNKQYPGNCKIGFTTSSPQYRLQKINGAGVVLDWDLAFSYKCSRPYDFEQALHLKLNDVRIRNDREFFDIDLSDAIQLIKEMGSMFGPI